MLGVTMAVGDPENKRTDPSVEVAPLERRIRDLESIVEEHGKIERRQQRLTDELTERIKELDCLYSISRLLERRDLTWDETLEEIVNLIPEAWQYPHFTCARLLISDRVFESRDFKRTKWRQVCRLERQGQTLGSLEVYSSKQEIDEGESRFLPEEVKLLEVIGERLSSLIEQQRERRMADLQQQRIIQLDKMVALGVLVSGVAHEINNPNNFIMLNTPLIQDAWRSIAPILDQYQKENGDFLVGGLSYSEFRDAAPSLFAGITEGSQRIKSIVDSLKRFARVDPSEMTYGINVNEVTRSAVTLLNNHIKKSTDRFSCSYGEQIPPIRGHYQRLEQVVINLLQNACDALPDKSCAIRIVTSFDQEGNHVAISVQDEGIGIDAEKLSSIQDPFYTTKRDRGGTGLGLSVSSGIVKSHDGQLVFESTLGRGTTATVMLPAPSARNDSGGI